MARLLFVLLASLIVAFPALSEEVINRFDVGIEVETDGDIILTETITVTAEGNQIRRGIFRDLQRHFAFDDGSIAFSRVTFNKFRRLLDELRHDELLSRLCTKLVVGELAHRGTVHRVVVAPAAVALGHELPDGFTVVEDDDTVLVG